MMAQAMLDCELGAFEEVVTSSSEIDTHDVAPSQIPTPFGDTQSKHYVHSEASRTDVLEQHAEANVTPNCVSGRDNHCHKVSVGPVFPRLRIGGVLLQSQRCKGSKLRGVGRESKPMRWRQLKENRVLLNVPDRMRATVSVMSNPPELSLLERLMVSSLPERDTSLLSAADFNSALSPIAPPRDPRMKSPAFDTSSCSPASPTIGSGPNKHVPASLERTPCSSKTASTFASTPKSFRPRFAPSLLSFSNQGPHEVDVVLTESSINEENPGDHSNGQNSSLDLEMFRVNDQERNNVSEQEGYLADISNDGSVAGDEPVAMDHFEKTKLVNGQA